ncbi:hypothetical protein VPH35_122337 [Triticum aestivum]
MSGAFASPATEAGNTGERLCGGNSERPASVRISRIGNDVKQYRAKSHPVQEGRKAHCSTYQIFSTVSVE